MTSLQTSIKQIDNESSHYITLGDVRSNLYAVNGTTVSTSWAQFVPSGNTAYSAYSVTVANSGALLKDMGKTVVSSGRTFRKVQLVVPGAASGSTFGVAGAANGSGLANEYLTGYLELGFDGTPGVTPAKVAKFGR